MTDFLGSEMQADAIAAADALPPEGNENGANRTRLDWFTTDLQPGGHHLMYIRPTSTRDPYLVPLGPEASWLLSAVLNELARADPDVPWAAARQAVLRGFYAATRTPPLRRF